MPKPALSRSLEAESKDNQNLDIYFLAKALLKYKASDLHLKVGRPPLFRINGKLMPAKMPAFTEKQVSGLIRGLISERQNTDLQEKKQVDFSFSVADLGRFRCNAFFQKGSLSAAIRVIPSIISDLSSLGVPNVLKDLVEKKRGLLLLTGATGNGKSTTMAGLIQYLNENHYLHVLTIEDPIEFIFRDIKSLITQREVGADTHHMRDALVAGLRQDPDVIVIGEMRDMETIQTALTAAETGHLVISTLHTVDTKSSIERIIEVFPEQRQNQVRMQLAFNLIGVISQRLIPRADGEGRILASEVLVKSPMIEDLILRNEIEKIPEAIANSAEYYHMQSMNRCLELMVKKGIISLEEGLKASSNPDDLKLLLSGLVRGEGYHPKAG